MNDRRKPLDEDAIMAMARELPREVQPRRDLWPGIEAAIREPREEAPAPWYGSRLFAQAAAVLLLVGASSGLTYLLVQDDPAAGGALPAGNGLVFEPVSGSFGARYTLGPDFQDARASVVDRLDAELERLPDETRAEVEKNLAAIRLAIAEINRALAEEPDNELLQELLISTYSEELAIMRRVDGITTSVMRRTDI